MILIIFTGGSGWVDLVAADGPNWVGDAGNVGPRIEKAIFDKHLLFSENV